MVDVLAGNEHDSSLPAAAHGDCSSALQRRAVPQRYLELGGHEQGGNASWLFSAAFHLFALILLSFLFTPLPSRNAELQLEVALHDADSEADQPFDFSLSDAAAGNVTAEDWARDSSAAAETAASSLSVRPLLAATPSADDESTPGSTPSIETIASPLATLGGGVQGRRSENRGALALGAGGTPQSEAAVERGLAWLAAHQLPNGSWVFDLNEKCPACRGACRDSGTNTSTTASTGLALLCFLGAGYTHEEGLYREVVADGLYYLQQQMHITSRGGDLRDQKAVATGELPALAARALQVSGATRYDSMYSHGIASLALTEAYAMTRDKALKEPAQQAVNFIVHAQFADGGWRYLPAPDSPGPGDMTVSGWQITTLKSGLLGGLEIPYEIWERIDAFLDGIQTDSGSTYLYVRGERGTKATTAIGLLCRMIRGWSRDAKPLNIGLAKLGGERPAANNMYYNFYASQVLHHAQGRHWEKWNDQMRDYLVDSQATEGHEAGSWYFKEAHSTSGGRLYTTAMAITTLEVYYRYMPLYQHDFIDAQP